MAGRRRPVVDPVWDVVGCPQCHAPAEVLDRFDLAGTGGPVQHMRIRCVHRHWFVMPSAATSL